MKNRRKVEGMSATREQEPKNISPDSADKYVPRSSNLNFYVS